MGKYHISADILRIIAALGVVLIHVTDPFLLFRPYTDSSSWWLLNFLNAGFRVSVPLFIIISGYFILDKDKNYQAGDFLKKRLLRVGIPFVLWVCIFFLWQKYFAGIDVNLIHIFDSLVRVALGHLYFLVIILGLYLIAPILHVYTKYASKNSQKYFLIATFLFSVGLFAINYFWPKAQVNVLRNIFLIFIPFVSYFFLGGYFQNVSKAYVTKPMRFFFGIALLLLTAVVAWTSKGDLVAYTRNYFSITIVPMTVMLFILFMSFEGWFQKRTSDRLLKLVKTFAAMSFGIYLVHPIMLDLVDLFIQMEPGQVVSPIWGYALFKTLLVFSFSFLFVYLVKKFPYSQYLLG